MRLPLVVAVGRAFFLQLRGEEEGGGGRIPYFGTRAARRGCLAAIHPFPHLHWLAPPTVNNGERQPPIRVTTFCPTSRKHDAATANARKIRRRGRQHQHPTIDNHRYYPSSLSGAAANWQGARARVRAVLLWEGGPSPSREGSRPAKQRRTTAPTTEFDPTRLHALLFRFSSTPMTTLLQSRQPLQVLSMSNQPKRRRSERLAGTLPPIPALSPARPSISRARAIRLTPVLTYSKHTMNKMAISSSRGAPKR